MGGEAGTLRPGARGREGGPAAVLPQTCPGKRGARAQQPVRPGSRGWAPPHPRTQGPVRTLHARLRLLGKEGGGGGADFSSRAPIPLPGHPTPGRGRGRRPRAPQPPGPPAVVAVVTARLIGRRSAPEAAVLAGRDKDVVSPGRWVPGVGDTPGASWCWCWWWRRCWWGSRFLRPLSWGWELWTPIILGKLSPKNPRRYNFQA